MSAAGRILRIDLTERKVEKEPTSSYEKDYIGGFGIGMRIFSEEVAPETRAFDPANVLMINTGPLTGTLFGNKCNWSSKTPDLAGAMYAHVGMGGQFASEVRFAGYDHVIIKGKAERPVYLFIDNDAVEIRDATHLWGLDVHETQKKIWEELSDLDVKIACIGPAGENLVVYALILSEIENTASKHGMGAVMGSKNLKAVAVRGTKGLKIGDPKAFLQLYDEYFENITKGKARLFTKTMQKEGLARQISEGYIYAYGVPVPDEVPPSPMMDFLKRHLVRPIGCAFCPIQCAELYSVPGIGNGGTQCVNYFGLIYQKMYKHPDNLDLWFKRTILANRLGLDSLSVDMLGGWLMDLYSEGIITAADTDGVPMEYASEKAIVTLIEKLARREGKIGELLADGIVPAAKKIGKNSLLLADQVGNSFPYGGVEYAPDVGPVARYRVDEVQRVPGFADGYGNIPAYAEIDAISPKEAAKIIDGFCDEASERVTGDRDFWKTPEYSKNSARFAVEKEDEFQFNDITGHCEVNSSYLDHYGMSYAFPDYVKWLSAATGVTYAEEYCREVARRVRTLNDAYNVLCQRVLREKPVIGKPPETLPSFPVPGRPRDAEGLRRLQEDYCDLRGYDRETGVPKRETLERLGLKSIADELDAAEGRDSQPARSLKRRSGRSKKPSKSP